MIYNDKIYTLEEITHIIDYATSAGYNVDVIINGEVYQVGAREDLKHD